MKPQEPIPHNYSMRSLNWIFLWSSVVLLGVTVLMVGYDYIRGWKWFQLEFLRMQRERIESELKTAESETNRKQLADLDAQRYIAEISVVQRRADAAAQQAEYHRQEKHVTDLQLNLQDVTRKRDEIGIAHV